MKLSTGFLHHKIRVEIQLILRSLQQALLLREQDSYHKSTARLISYIRHTD
jgi:hypothetical protein